MRPMSWQLLVIKKKLALNNLRNMPFQGQKSKMFEERGTAAPTEGLRRVPSRRHIQCACLYQFDRLQRSPLYPLAVFLAIWALTAEYQELEMTAHLFLVAIKTVGLCSQQAIELVQEIGRRTLLSYQRNCLPVSEAVHGSAEEKCSHILRHFPIWLRVVRHCSHLPVIVNC